MQLVRTSFFNAIAVVARVASALFINKMLAIYIGPAGYAVIGQFQNAVSVIVSLAGGVVATGVTKATAQHFDDEKKQHFVWQTAIRFSIGASLFAGLILIFTSSQLSVWLLHRADMSGIFVWLAVALPAMAANNLLLAILNGKKEVVLYVTANIAGSLASTVVTGGLVYLFGLYGVLIAFTITPAIVLLTTAILITRRSWFKARFLWGGINRSAASELTGFALMGLTSAIAMPVSYMLIRNHIVVHLGLLSAGYWQASWKISEIYLMLVTSTLTVYYLPRLAEIKTASELRAEIVRVYRLVLPIVITGAFSIFLLRDFIIHTLFTSDFGPMRELFPWQLTGDVIKIGSWVLAYVMLGRAMVRIFVLTEIGFSISFVLLSFLLEIVFGLVGVTIAYAINYLVYWAVMWRLIKHEMSRMAKSHS